MDHRAASPGALNPGTRLRTPRLLLRPWRAADREPFARLNADPRVMEHFPAPLTRAESDALADRIEAGLAANGFGLWAVEVAGTGAFIGFTGLSRPGFSAHFTPAVEVAWRLARHAWGRGYATEAATAAVHHGFTRAGLSEIVSFTARENHRSQAVMRRLGMTRDPADDFDHPALPPGHRLTRHVLYRLRPEQAPPPATITAQGG
ncbi:GNAT family N-acetyltransferase [Streptomonospora nanhaiensis]|uniref:RimJ/RimL family protein N-acetyltransferase n=1 Tax=Streptomonospora nanhaiensis TaxID=1323731 RepID=A0A853BI53_9ACTN|nr:GNAT family N-acetyltransferase [Streptomonospora nanhaiensis]MBV2366287.1 GNAT family N-acetyltransferase [Streptomonospora nanhaiensis]MBX9387902.1 GNAT family N-acetyltransferase [Streptomonospora nanhaiensis]NYI94415.1 RimJ/RimL family protein N-acetyltransferase [Streptomonospora nanhaiensis]